MSAMQAASKRYLAETVLAFALYGAAVFATDHLLANASLSPAESTALALAPMLPVAMFAKAMLRFYRTLDEMHRKIASDAVVVAASVVGFGSFAWGWLEIRLAVPALPTTWLLPGLFAAYGLALPLVSRRYAGSGP